MSQLRISAHNLNMEIGGYLGQRRDRRKCKICNNGEIENEFHFVMKCAPYQNLRDKTLKKLNDLDPYE